MDKSIRKQKTKTGDSLRARGAAPSLLVGINENERTTLLVELRPSLNIHLHPQTSKRFHLRFHLGRVDHPKRVK